MFSRFQFRLIRKRPAVIAGLVLLGFVAMAGCFAPWLAPYGPTEMNLKATRQPPSTEHLLGTDELGRDVFSRLLYSVSSAYWGGFLALGITFGLGTTFGLFSGYKGGRWDYFAMRLVDFWLAL